MEDQYSILQNSYPVHTNTFAIPNDRILYLMHDVYKPSEDTIKLKSEQNRTIFAELFIGNYKLGTLVDLCIRSLARGYGPDPLPFVGNNKLYEKIHYDTLDVEMPLKDCYHIKNDDYWKRVVLTKTSNKALALKTDYNWKENGISRKFVEIIENCPAEYWPEEEMKELAIQIKDFVNEMHIRRLQSMPERYFEKYYNITSATSSEYDESISEITDSSIPTSIEDEELEEEIIGDNLKSESLMEFERQKKEEKMERKRYRNELREAKAKAREEHEIKRQRREAHRLKKLAMEEILQKKKNGKKPKRIKSFFDIEISESEDDGDDKIVDKRNLELYITKKMAFDYPAEYCHHIDLSILQYFTNMESFTMEFLGPLLEYNYHYRHMNFSYEDMEQLAFGVSKMEKLRVFRLRNSRMDSKKLGIIVNVLKNIETLQIVDFGHDVLNDSCAIYFPNLFSGTAQIKSLELESNELGVEAMQKLGESLKDYRTCQLEYLGLARNPLTDEALHILITSIIGTNHIKSLNLLGLQFVTNNGIDCCMANELLRQHPILLNLDISTININTTVAEKIVDALEFNTNILGFNCVGCDLDEQTQVDIRVLLERNQYIVDNPFVNDTSCTLEDFDAWVNRIKNPIMLSILEKRRQLDECIKNRPKEWNSSIENLKSRKRKSIREYHSSFYNQWQEIPTSETVQESASEIEGLFKFNPNNFNETEFLEHVYVPGPKERFFYFRKKKQEFVQM